MTSPEHSPIPSEPPQSNEPETHTSDIPDSFAEYYVGHSDNAPQPVDLNTPRIMGLHSHLGKAWVSDDFDDELGDDFWLNGDP